MTALAESSRPRHFRDPLELSDGSGSSRSPMKVTVERAELLKSLGHVHRVVERRNTIPILANVLIKAERSKLSFKATDLDLEVTEAIAAEVGPGGSTTVPAHMFYEIVRKLPEGSQVALEASGDRAVLAIRAGRSRFTLQTLPESDFPDLAAGEMTIHSSSAPPNSSDLSTRPSSQSRPRKRATTSTASIFTPRAPPTQRLCGQSQPMATVWPRSSCRCQRAPTGCLVSLFRARPSARFSG